MSSPLRVGIVGARGIGKHHAKWFARAGCDVTAIYGTTEASAQASADVLRDLFGFTGRAFSDWGAFRAEGNFEAASVCSPTESHYANVRDLAADGTHILCEKPLVWDWNATPLELIEEATLLVETCARHRVVLGMNAQYPAVLEGFDALHRRVLGREPRYDRLDFVMATKGQPRSPHGAAEAWVDLGPHPLAVLDRLHPGGVDWPTLRHDDGPHEVVLDFDWISGPERLPVHIECRRGTLQRTIGTQDLSAVYEGANLDGEFIARLTADGQEWTGPDFMRTCVERFVEAVQTGDAGKLLVPPDAALRQQEALVGVWKHCWGQSVADFG